MITFLSIFVLILFVSQDFRTTVLDRAVLGVAPSMPVVEMSNNRRLAYFLGIVVALMVLKTLLMPHAPENDLLGRVVTVDMHTHTTESDGDRTAEEQLAQARRTGLTSIWITDHDMIRTLDRTKELQREARRVGVAVGFGVEITVDFSKKEHHLLGYFPDSVWAGAELLPAMVALQKACAEVKASRENRNEMMVRFLNEVLTSAAGGVYFVDRTQQAALTADPLRVQEVAKWAGKNANLMEPTSLGRPHFRAYLIQRFGIRDDLIFGPRSGDGSALLLANGDVVFEDKQNKSGQRVEALLHSATLERRGIAFEPLPIVHAIRLITAAGGRAVLVSTAPHTRSGERERVRETV